MECSPKEILPSLFMQISHWNRIYQYPPSESLFKKKNQYRTSASFQLLCSHIFSVPFDYVRMVKYVWWFWSHLKIFTEKLQSIIFKILLIKHYSHVEKSIIYHFILKVYATVKFPVEKLKGHGTYIIWKYNFPFHPYPQYSWKSLMLLSFGWCISHLFLKSTIGNAFKVSCI